jgi:two-component system NtrC family response regulator
VILAEGPLVTAEGLNLPVPGADALPFSLREARANAERSAIVAALAAANGNMSKAAELLGVSRPTLYDLVQKLGIPPAE